MERKRFNIEETVIEILGLPSYEYEWASKKLGIPKAPAFLLICTKETAWLFDEHNIDIENTVVLCDRKFAEELTEESLREMVSAISVNEESMEISDLYAQDLFAPMAENADPETKKLCSVFRKRMSATNANIRGLADRFMDKAAVILNTDRRPWWDKYADDLADTTLRTRAQFEAYGLQKPEALEEYREYVFRQLLIACYCFATISKDPYEEVSSEQGE